MESRRSYLKRTGVVLLSLAVSSTTTIASTTKDKKHKQPAMIIDTNRCMGCQSCIIACKEQNKTPKGFFVTTVTKQSHGTYPSAWHSYKPSLCHHCEDAPCLNACVPKATFPLDSGIIVVDWEHCIGCGACVQACPYDARFQDPTNQNKVDKCDFCATLLEKGLEPACVETCPSSARIFGDLAHPQGEFATYLAMLKAENIDALQKPKERILYTTVQKG